MPFPALPRSVAYSTVEPGSAPLLFKPLKIRDVTLKNRIVVSPMCQYSSSDGFANSWHMVHFGQFAQRGAGLVIVEATAVQQYGRITPNCLGIWKDEHIPDLAEIVNFAHSVGAAIGIEIAHAGRKGSCLSPFLGKGHDTLAKVEDGGWPDKVVGPSPLQDWKTAGTPREMTVAEIKETVEAFGLAAERAYKAGFDVLDIHAAQGYLISSFLSPLTNKRTDEYGGKWDNRVRILLDIVNSIRRYWPETKPLFVRLSCTEFAAGGWDIEDSVKLSKILSTIGVDLIDCSSGGNVPYQVTHGHQPGWNTTYSRAISEQVPKILTSTVGGYTDPVFANETLEKKHANLVMFGREFLRNPGFVIQAAKTLNVKLTKPPQYSSG